MKQSFFKITMLIAAAAIVFAFAACTDNDEFDVKSENAIEKTDTDVDRTEVGQLSAGSSVTPFNLRADVDAKWLVSVEWDRKAHQQPVYCYPDSGVGPATLKIVTLDNFTQEVRHANIVIRFPKDESKNITIPITQQRARIGNDGEIEINYNAQRGVGFGYNAYLGYCEPRCIITPILKVEQMNEDGAINYDFSQLDTYQREESGSSVEELARKLNVTAHASGDYAGFAASVDAEFNGADKSTTSNEFAWMDINVRSCHASLKGESLARLFDKYMTDGAYSDINGIGWEDREGNVATDYPATDEGFRKLVMQYGTHLVVGGVLGGQIRTSVVCNTSRITSAYNASVALQANYSSDFANLDINSTAKAQQASAVSKNKNGFSFKAKVRGGGKDDGSFAALDAMVANMSKSYQGGGTEKIDLDKDAQEKAEIPSENTAYEAAGAQWKASLTTSDGKDPGEVLKNVVLLDFDGEDQLIPLYELVNRRRPGGEDRYQKFMTWFKNTMKKDPTILSYKTDLSSYIKVPPTKIDPTIKMDNVRNLESLIQDIYLANGAHVARICSEYIPMINPSKRVNVIYPIVNGVPRYNLGLFCGDEASYPAQVSWGYEKDMTEPIVTTLKGFDKGQQKVAYLRGNHLTLERDTKYAEKDYLTTTAKPYVLKYGNETYYTVKINDYIYTRGLWKGTTFGNGTSYRQASSDYAEMGSTSYYRVKAYTRYQKAFGGFAPQGWGVPYAHQYNKMLNMIADIKGNKPDGSIGGSFTKGGVFGFTMDETGFYLVDNEYCGSIKNSTICNNDHLYLGCLDNDDMTFWDDVTNDSKNNSATDMHCPALVVNKRAGTATVSWWDSGINNHTSVTQWNRSTWKNPSGKDPDRWMIDNSSYTDVHRRGYYVYMPVVLCTKVIK